MQGTQLRLYVRIVPVDFAAGDPYSSLVGSDDEARGKNGHLPRCAHGAVVITDDRKRNPEPLDERSDARCIFLQVDRNHLDTFGGQLVPHPLQRWHLGHAGRTPRCPKVDDNRASAVGIECHFLAPIVLRLIGGGSPPVHGSKASAPKAIVAVRASTAAPTSDKQRDASAVAFIREYCRCGGTVSRRARRVLMR